MKDKDLTNKFKFYQDIRLWPKNSDFNYEAWLDNFDAGEERNLAQLPLTAYKGSRLVDKTKDVYV